MLSVHDFEDAGFAKRVATLGDVGVVEGLEANDALGKFAHDLINADLDLFVIFRALSLKSWWLVFDHFDVIWMLISHSL